MQRRFGCIPLTIIPIEYTQKIEISDIVETLYSTGRIFIIYSMLEILSLAARYLMRILLFPTNGTTAEILSFWRIYTIAIVIMDLPVILAVIFMAMRSKTIGGVLRNNLIKYAFIPLVFFSFLRIFNAMYTILNMNLLLEAIRIRLSDPNATLPSPVENAIMFSFTLDKATTFVAILAFLMLGYGYYLIAIFNNALKGLSFPSFLLVLSTFLLFFGFSAIMVDISTLLLGKKLRDTAPKLQGYEKIGIQTETPNALKYTSPLNTGPSLQTSRPEFPSSQDPQRPIPHFI